MNHDFLRFKYDLKIQRKICSTVVYFKYLSDGKGISMMLSVIFELSYMYNKYMSKVTICITITNFSVLCNHIYANNKTFIFL